MLNYHEMNTNKYILRKFDILQRYIAIGRSTKVRTQPCVKRTPDPLVVEFVLGIVVGTVVGIIVVVDDSCDLTYTNAKHRMRTKINFPDILSLLQRINRAS
jgi:hypothetical protein